MSIMVVKAVVHYPKSQRNFNAVLDLNTRIMRLIVLDFGFYHKLGSGFYVDLDDVLEEDGAMPFVKKKKIVHVCANSLRSMKYQEHIVMTNSGDKTITILGGSLRPDVSPSYDKKLQDNIDNVIKGVYLRQVKGKLDLPMVLLSMGSGAMIWNIVTALLRSRGVQI